MSRDVYYAIIFSQVINTFSSRRYIFILIKTFFRYIGDFSGLNGNIFRLSIQIMCVFQNNQALNLNFWDCISNVMISKEQGAKSKDSSTLTNMF